MAEAVLTVPDISCEHCERTITGALGQVEGVRQVAVDIPAKQVRVEYDEARVDLERVKSLLAEEDYPVASVAQAAAKAETAPGCACCAGEARG
jgi:copper chaperone